MAEKLYKLREVLQHLHQMISCIDLFDTLHIAKGFWFNSCFLCFAYFFNQTLLQFSFETKSTLVSTTKLQQEQLKLFCLVRIRRCAIGPRSVQKGSKEMKVDIFSF